MVDLRHDFRRGATLILAATLFTALLNGLQKHLSDHVPLMELLFFRNLFSLPMVLLIAARQRRLVLRTRHFRGHVLRSGFGLVSMVMTVVAVAALPLAEQQVFSYTQPLFITILAIPFLGEHPRPARWVAVLVGFSGVMVAALGQGLGHGSAGGGGSPPAWAYGVAIAQGLFGALTTLQIRQLSATESASTITLWQGLLMTAATALALPFFWQTPTLVVLLELAAVGLLAGLAQVLQTEAFASAQVSAIGPYTYAGLIWAAVVGWTFFGDVPGLAMILGALLIMGAGLAMLRHEARPRRRPAAEVVLAEKGAR